MAGGKMKINTDKIMFQQELIPILFKDWKTSSDVHIWNPELRVEISFMQDDKNGQAMKSKTKYSIYHADVDDLGNLKHIEYKLPKTLKDFIDNCENFGIKLEWNILL